MRKLCGLTTILLLTAGILLLAAGRGSAAEDSN